MKFEYTFTWKQDGDMRCHFHALACPDHELQSNEMTIRIISISWWFWVNFVVLSYKYHLFMLQQWFLHQLMGRLEALRVFGWLYNNLSWIMTYTLEEKILIYQRFSVSPTQFIVKWGSDKSRSSFRMIEKNGELPGSCQYLDDTHLFPWRWHIVVVLYNRLIMTMVSSWRCSYRNKWCLLVNQVQLSTYWPLVIVGTPIGPPIH